MAGLLAIGLAASVYLVYVLEILKFRRLRAWQMRGADPDTSEHEIDAEVERELETGEFRKVSGDSNRTGEVGVPALAARRQRWYLPSRPGRHAAERRRR